jgi:hypothetical protein
MRAIKLLGLTGLMALLAMALVGVPSAMAEPTGLCTTEASEKSPCESTVSHLHGESVGAAVFLTSIANIECTVLVLGSVTEGSPLTVKANFTYTGCKDKSFGACEVKELSGSSSVEMLKEGHETAKVTVGSGEVLVKCSIGVHCVYKIGGIVGTAKGPLLATQKNGEIAINKQTLTKVSGFLCPSTASVDLTITPLNATYIVGQMLCVPDLQFGAYLDGSSLYICKVFDGSPKGTWRLTSD